MKLLRQAIQNWLGIDELIDGFDLERFRQEILDEIHEEHNEIREEIEREISRLEELL